MLRLGDHFREAKPTRAIFTTFALSPSLFDSHIVRRLLEGGCEEILLLTDRSGYEALLAERGAVSYAGSSYWVCPVEMAPFAFHPKVALLWSRDEARLYVMSANLTHGGLWRNAEIVDRLVWTRADGGPAAELRKAAEWVERLPVILDLPTSIRSPLERMTADLKTLLPSSAEVTPSPAAQFVHNLDEPLLPQVSRLASGEVDEVVVAAPFYGPGLTPLIKLGETFPKSRITAAQGTKTGTINPAASKSIRRRVTVATCRLPGPVRPWHAKFILLKSRSQWVFASGSANMTSAALLKKGGEGNVEAGVVRVGAKEAVSDLVAALKLSPVDWDDLTYRPIPTQAQRVAGPVIRWAEIAGFRLRLEIAGVSPDDAGAVRRLALHLRAGSRDDFSFKVTKGNTGIEVEASLPKEVDAELGTSLFASIEARSSARSPYARLTSLVICPNEIAAPVAVRRFRAALRAIQRNEIQSDDVREVLSFLRDNLSGLLLHLKDQPGFKRSAKHTPPPTPTPDRPAVFFLEEGESAILSGLSIGGLGNDLIGGLPSLFRALLQGSQSPLIQIQTSVDGADEEPADDADDGEGQDRSDAPEYDPDSLAEDVRRFCDWVNEAFRAAAGDDDVAIRQWPVRAQLIEFAMVFARFFYLRGAQTVDPTSPLGREYVNRIVGLLTPTFSASGRAWRQSTGWFVRVKEKDRNSALRVSPSLAAQVLFHAYELLDPPESRDAMQKVVSPILEGLTMILGAFPTDSTDIAAALGAIVAAYKLPESRVQEILELTGLAGRAETPEQQALTRFGMLLALQEAVLSMQLLEEARPHTGAPGASLEAAAERLADLRSRCESLYPDETARYFALGAKGRWRNFFPVRDSKGSACPRCHMNLPLKLVGELRNVLKTTSCPSCHALIVPIPAVQVIGDADAGG